MSRIEELVYGGSVFEDKGEHEKAIKLFNQASILAPLDADIQEGLGMLYSSVDKYKDAESCCLNAVELEPENPRHRSALSLIYLEQDKFDEAEKYQKSALELDPTDIKGLSNLCAIYYNQEKFDEAKEISLKMLKQRGQGEKVPGWLKLIHHSKYNMGFAYADWSIARENRRIFDSIISDAYYTLAEIAGHEEKLKDSLGWNLRGISTELKMGLERIFGPLKL